MKKDNFARTIRIDLPPRRDVQKETPTVTLRPPRVSGTTYEAQYATEVDAQCSDYQRLLQCIYDAVLITDSEGIVLECNQRAIDFLLYPENDILGRSISQFICGVDDAVMSSIRKNLRDQRYTLIEGACQRKDETVFPAEIAVNRLDLSESGRLSFFIRNISIRKRAQEALQEAVAEVERHDQQRSQFISNVSHELRTPLTSMIYAITNMLRGVVGPLSPETEEYLKMLIGDCKRMLATVNDILDLRKIESNSLSLIKSPIPYARWVRRSVESLRVQALQKSIDMEIITEDQLWFVDCDAQKIERVLINLVGNAIKFTPEGGHIRVTVSNENEHTGYVRVSVDDNGIGIPADYIAHVTDRYYTVGDQPSGSGLGLAISKEIVAMHGGELTVESPVPGTDCGTRISFTMPLADPPLVMVIENDQDLCEDLRHQIGAYGYRVRVSDAHEDPVDSVLAVKPDIIILDLDRPDSQGRDVIMKMKSNPNSARIPVMVMTSMALNSSLSDILRNFGIPVMTKPWDQTKLIDGIANAFLGRIPFMN